LIVGREDVFHLQAPSAVCVDDVNVQTPKDANKNTWKPAKPEELEIKVALNDQSAGPLKLKLHQFGLAHADDCLCRPIPKRRI